MDQFIAALMGAIVGGLIATLGAFALDTHQRNKRRENLRAAIAIEVASLVELVKRQEYAAHLRAFADRVLTLAPDDNRAFKLPIKQSYFTVYETNASAIGDLPTEEAVEIIGFYQQARSIVDSVIDETQLDPRITSEDISDYYKSIANLVENLCIFGRNLVKKLTNSKVIELIDATAERLIEKSKSDKTVEQNLQA